jgi:hypothetical protein
MAEGRGRVETTKHIKHTKKRLVFRAYAYWGVLDCEER